MHGAAHTKRRVTIVPEVREHWHVRRGPSRDALFEPLRHVRHTNMGGSIISSLHGLDAKSVERNTFFQQRPIS